MLRIVIKYGTAIHQTLTIAYRALIAFNNDNLGRVLLKVVNVVINVDVNVGFVIDFTDVETPFYERAPVHVHVAIIVGSDVSHNYNCFI